MGDLPLAAPVGCWQCQGLNTSAGDRCWELGVLMKVFRKGVCPWLCTARAGQGDITKARW